MGAARFWGWLYCVGLVGGMIASQGNAEDKAKIDRPGNKQLADPYYIDLSDRPLVVGTFEAAAIDVGVNYRPGVFGEGEKTRLDYGSQLTYLAGARVSYKNYGLHVRFPLALRYPKEENRVQARALDVRSQFFYQGFALDLAYQSYNGLDVKELIETDSGEKNEAFRTDYQRPEMKAETVTALLNYVLFHKKWSFRAPFDYSEVQQRTGFSPLFNLKLSRHKYEDPVTFIPEEFAPRFGPYQDLRSLKRLAATLGAGAGVTFVPIRKKGFYISGVGGAGLGYQVGSYHAAERDHAFSSSTWSFDIRVGLGYSDDYFLGGTTYTWITDSYNAGDDLTFVAGYASWALFGGYRF